jgi:hypothetical protein
MSALRRIASLYNQIRPHAAAIVVNERILFPESEKSAAPLMDDPRELDVYEAPLYHNSFTMSLRVNHDEQSIRLKTESMSDFERLTIYIRNKTRLRTLYPNYIIQESHT